MSDEANAPHFPAPRARDKAEADARADAVAPVAAPATPFRSPAEKIESTADEPPKIVVSRADAPPSESPDALAIDKASAVPGAPAPVKLTKEEIRAFLAVENVHHTSKWKKVAKRGAVLTIPTGLISFAVQTIFGWWGAGACIVFAIYWAARPLLKQDREGWS